MHCLVVLCLEKEKNSRAPPFFYVYAYPLIVPLGPGAEDVGSQAHTLRQVHHRQV